MSTPNMCWNLLESAPNNLSAPLFVTLVATNGFWAKWTSYLNLFCAKPDLDALPLGQFPQVFESVGDVSCVVFVFPGVRQTRCCWLVVVKPSGTGANAIGSMDLDSRVNIACGHGKFVILRVARHPAMAVDPGGRQL